MLSFILNALKIVFLLGFLVFIHEGGHFIIAKMSKVKVNEFAIGFGPTIFSKVKGDTKYALRLIPLGGFVSMEGEEERSNVEGSFSNTSIPKKIAIILAGGIVNIIFGLIVYFVLIACVGNFLTNTVDYTLDNYPAQTVGIISGDKILSINNKKINNPKDINEILSTTKGDLVKLEIERNNKKIDINVKPTNIKTKDIGVYFSKSEKNTPTKISSLDENSPASIAGLKQNDIILSVNEENVNGDIYKLINLIQNTDKEEIVIKVERENKILDFRIIPNSIDNYYLGVVFKQAENTLSNKIYYGIIETGNFVCSIFDNLKEMFTGKVSANQMVGIVGISDIVVKTSGIYEYFYMLALISLSLGLTNLLPFPPLDGGKFVIYLIEAIRKKPMAEKIEVQLQMIGFAILIALSIYVTYNDILRII